MKEAQEKEARRNMPRIRPCATTSAKVCSTVLVLSSLYFIAHKMLFPTIGLVAGVAGAAIAIAGYFE